MTTAPPDLSPEQRAALHHLARVAAAKKCAEEGDVLGWGRALFPEKFPKPFCRELHEYLAEIMSEPRTVTEAPRGHAKTTIKCFLVPLYLALNHPDLFHHFLNVQSTQAKALAVNTSIQFELENNRELIALYGVQKTTLKWTDQQFVTAKGIIFTAVGTGQSIRGLNYRNKRPDYIVVDDLYDEEDVNNVDATEKKNAWFWGSLYPARAATRVTSIHVQGTAVNDADLLALLKDKRGWRTNSFSAIKDWEKWIPLWPEAHSAEDLKQDYDTMPRIIFMREMQNSRRDAGTSIVKPEWLNNWEYDPSTLGLGTQRIVLGVRLIIDPSIGKKKENDASGFAVIMKTQSVVVPSALPTYYIEELYNERLSLQDRLDLAKRIEVGRRAEARLTEGAVESISGFDDFGDLVSKTLTVPVTRINKVPDKVSHLEKKSQFFQNGRVFISMHISPELRAELKKQLTTNHPRHDDLRDAVLHGLDDESGNWSSWV